MQVKTLLPLVFLASCGGSEAIVSSDGGTSSAPSSSPSSSSGSTSSGNTSSGSTSGGSTSGGSSSSSGATGEKFSFFVTSYAALQALSGSSKGFGGDLRYGETGQGAGLRGADKICATIAERSLTGAGSKSWRAFLSASAGDDGKQVNAIDRIGEGPWYDRLGRVFAMTKADLMSTRPNGDSAIKNDFPNEDGVPNHKPDPTKAAVDNHDMLTGTGTDGTLYASSATCLDWTSALGKTATEGKPRVGHSWPRNTGGGGGGGGGGQDHWMSSLTEAGCAPGVNLVESGGPKSNEVTVGSGGGYGGFYCFSLTP